MPNHVTNRLKLSGADDRIKEMLKAIQNDKFGIGTVDFNKVIPMPESLNIEAGSQTDRGLKIYRDFVAVYTLGGTINMDKLSNIPAKSEEIFLKQRTDIKPDEWELGKAAWNNIQNHGAPTWYEWAIGNWGTKWNSYGYENGYDYSNDGELCFQTAWGAPHTIIKKLSEMYPDITMRHQWADEDIGQNCGQHIYLGGNVIDEYFPDYGKRSVEFAAEVMRVAPLDFGLVENVTGTDYIYCEGSEYDVIDLFGKPALFSSNRIPDDEMPIGLFRYDLRHSDDGESFAAIEPNARVNYGGTVITDWQLDFADKDHIPLTDDTAPNFNGEEMTFGKYLKDKLDESQSQSEMEMN
ncbi:MAG: hypothetical protein Q4C12_07655 [Clostridia bacterium]|nr:hypothetical protein [Clostridia bacterium]